MAGFTTGQVVTAANLNSLPQVLAVGTAYAGIPPAVGSATPYLEIFASTVVTTSAAGEVIITFPTPFPNGLVTVVVSNGDVGVGVDLVVSVAPAVGVNVNGFTIHVTTGNTAAAYAGAFRCNWIAKGW